MTVSRIAISSEGPTFSRIAQGFGSSMRWGKGPRQVLEHVAECMDLGITTLDIAAVYGDGRAETLLGDALTLDRSVREKVQLVTKCSIGTWSGPLYHYDTSKAHILWWEPGKRTGCGARRRRKGWNCRGSSGSRFGSVLPGRGCRDKVQYTSS